MCLFFLLLKWKDINFTHRRFVQITAIVRLKNRIPCLTLAWRWGISLQSLVKPRMPKSTCSSNFIGIFVPLVHRTPWHQPERQRFIKVRSSGKSLCNSWEKQGPGILFLRDLSPWVHERALRETICLLVNSLRCNTSTTGSEISLHLFRNRSTAATKTKKRKRKRLIY